MRAHAGGSIYHHASGVFLAAGPANHQGPTFVASPQDLFGFGGWPSGVHTAGSSGLAYAGNAEFALEVCGLPAGTMFAFLAMSGASAPLWPGGLGVVWPTLPFASVSPGALVGTTATFPLPLPGWAAGFQFDAQWIVFGAGGAISLSNGVHVEVCIL